MPVINVKDGAAAAPAKQKSTSLLAALNRMQWDSVLAIVMASDPYYHYTVKQPEQPRGDAAAELKTEAAPEHWFRRYVMSSSCTRLLVHAGAVGYLAYVMTHPSQYVPCHVVVTGTSNDGAAAAAAAAATECFLYQGAEGMQLLMRGKMPKWAVLLHAVAGSLLLPLALTQKESVWYMQFARKAVVVSPPLHDDAGTAGASSSRAGAPEDHTRVEEVRTGDAQAHSAAKKVQLRRARVSRRHHGNCGFMTGVSVLVMVAGGVSLRSYSVFSAPDASSRAGILNFASAMFLFAAPWVILAPATTASAVNSKAVAHALLGSLLVKAILAVPFERALGGLWQRAAGVQVALPPQRWWKPSTMVRDDVRVEVTQHVEAELERVYYKSIVATTIIFGVWGVVDIVRFVRLAQKCIATDEKTKRKA